MQVNMEGIDVAALFAAGAYSSGLSHGMSVKQAEDFAYGICKEAASKRRPKWVDDEEDDDEEDTFWGRNKGWIIPALVGTGAFLFGSHAGQHKRPDMGHFENAWDVIKDRAGRLFGMSYDALYNSMSKAPNFKDHDAWQR